MRCLRLLLVALLLAGCTQTAPSTSERTEWSQSVVVPSGGSQEVNLEAKAGALLDVHLASPYGFEWDLHSHRDGEVTTWREGSGKDASFQFEAPHDGVYSLFLKNTGEGNVPVRVNLAGEFRVLPSA